MSLNYEQARALVALSEDPNWQIVVDYLRKRLAEQDVANRLTDGVNMPRGQGRSLELSDVLSDIENCEKTFTRLREQRMTRKLQQG